MRAEVNSSCRSPDPGSFPRVSRGRLEKQRCLVVGAAGFVGSHLSRALAGAGAEVHALIGPSTSTFRITDLENRITVARADLSDPGATRAAVAAASPDVVFHLATPSRGGTSRDPAICGPILRGVIDPLLVLIEALRDLDTPPRMFIRAGTIAEYGRTECPFREDDLEKPQNAYGAAMLAATKLLTMLNEDLPFEAITARLALTYGSMQSDSFMIPSLIQACLSGNPFTIRRPADRRDLIHVDDVVEGFIRIAECPGTDCDTVNIATGVAPRIDEVAAHLVALTGCDPSLLSFSTCHDDAGETLCSDSSRARELYGWGPTISVLEGLSMVVRDGEGVARDRIREKARGR